MFLGHFWKTQSTNQKKCSDKSCSPGSIVSWFKINLIILTETSEKSLIEHKKWQFFVRQFEQTALYAILWVHYEKTYHLKSCARKFCLPIIYDNLAVRSLFGGQKWQLVVIFSQKKITLLSQIAVKNIKNSPEKSNYFQTLANIRYMTYRLINSFHTQFKK